jgi:hypothetical protein
MGSRVRARPGLSRCTDVEAPIEIVEPQIIVERLPGFCIVHDGPFLEMRE